MDAKITKQRLGRLLSYDWVKIVALAVAAIVLWSLVFTTTATRITPAQQFTVFNYYSNAPLGDGFYNVYNKTFSENKFSYEIIEENVNDLTTGGEEYAGTLLEARLGTDEGDVMFIPHVNDPSTKVDATEEGGEPTYTTYMQGFFNNWYYYIADVDEYLADMRAYVSAYYTDGNDVADDNYIDGTMNKEKVRADFLARIERNKDKRFKKSEQIEAGVLKEYERFEKYAAALVQFDKYLADGTVTLTHLQAAGADGTVYREGNYAVNLCPENGKTEKLKEQFYYEEEVDGKPKKTAKNMHVMFFDMKGVENGFQYESLIYVNEVIAAALTDAASANE
ncbi:MAG: hypothetical protein IJX91_04305 [Clostridia bacterium]|nr:hypothetical protein [Clostridia bacterium]